jgi:hypothetical protein
VSAEKQAKRAELSPQQLADKRAAERAEYYSRTGREGLTGLSLEDRAEAHLRRSTERAAEIASRMAGSWHPTVGGGPTTNAAERAAALALRLSERQAHSSATASEREAQAALKAAERAAARAAALSRHLAKREAKAAKAERKRQAIAARASHLIALLNGTAPGERISDTEGWDRVTAELRKVWPLSGDKQCTECGAVVPPEAMLPPGPGNFYEGQCRGCSTASYRANRAALGIACGDPPLILLKDGSRVTVGEIARRHHERERNRRVKRFGRAWR